MSRRKTQARIRVAVAIMQNPAARIYGYWLMQHAHVLSGTLYPILDDFVNDGWAIDGWEFSESTGRPRRYYELTPKGKAELAAVAQTKEPPPVLP